MQDTATAIEALADAGVTNGPAFAAGVAWLQSHQAYSIDALSRQIIALSKAGRDTASLVTRLINWRNDSTFSWGAYDHYSGSSPDTAMALEAIKQTGTAYNQEGSAVCFILNQQNADHGWSYIKSDDTPQTSQIISTASNLIALNRYNGYSIDCTDDQINNSVAVGNYINTGIAWLKAQQKLPGGGFGQGSAGTVLETSLAYRALVAVLGADDSVAVSAQNFLVAQQQADGNWGDKDTLATTLTLAALPSTTLADNDKDGLPDGVETPELLGTNPNLADSRTLIKGNGMETAGTTTAMILAQATLNQPYSTTLAGNGGTQPYTWSVISGSLPDGLTLNGTTGQISGTPTQRGAFNFVYRVAAADLQISVAGQIYVNAPIQVPDMPGWAALLLAAALIAAMKHIKRHTKTFTA
ncbi:putative Ig domain-containing protein [Methylomonas methanica]|uniref:Ig family protein n=1 Tax=Methylomonas methanica (strain DSM 25384 / MC09) TaxID=857087 RepID=G0A3Z1_METMM|nr:putative Ig domain-containing protein [Methylomonas methanica]AEG02763.1 Ig family protein [Methylomonas methanica MC09]